MVIYQYRLSDINARLPILLILFFGLSAHAEDSGIPNAGSILQQTLPVTPPLPSQNELGLKIESAISGKLPPSEPFMVNSLLISGNQTIDTTTLHALVADAENTKLSLPQLAELAARITDYYHESGHPLARAFIPAQTIQSGVVRIEVMEARYGAIQVDNHSRVEDALLQNTLSSLQSAQPILQAGMEQALLLLSDIPGISAHSILKPGNQLGTSDLFVNIQPEPAVSGNISVDDYGNRYTGRVRGNGSLNFINPLHHGDILTLNGLSAGEGMSFGRIAYNTLLNGLGTHAGGSYVALQYHLGDISAALNAHGVAQIGSLWIRQPLIRRHNFNLYGLIQYERAEMQDHIDRQFIRNDRSLDSGTFSLSGDMRDGFLSGGITTWHLGLTFGQVGFDDATAQLFDAAAARTQGLFSKLNLNLSRLQSLSDSDMLYLSFAFQQASGNLDSSKKMSVGGAYTVRAYDMGAASGDIGYQGTLEFRHFLGSDWYGQCQAIAFVDSAYVMTNANTIKTNNPNSATLSGVGAGLNWLGPKLGWLGGNQLNAKVYIAAPVGPVPALIGTTNVMRAWLEIGMEF